MRWSFCHCSLCSVLWSKKKISPHFTFQINNQTSMRFLVTESLFFPVENESKALCLYYLVLFCHFTGLTILSHKINWAFFDLFIPMPCFLYPLLLFIFASFSALFSCTFASKSSWSKLFSFVLAWYHLYRPEVFVTLSLDVLLWIGIESFCAWILPPEKLN